MGPLKNTKHEAFARGIFEGKSGRQAYLDAGYNCSAEAADAAASRLLKADKVAARVATLQERVADRAVKVIVTKEMLISRMLETADDAKDKGVHSAAIRGYELLGRDKGAFQERKTITVRSLDELSEEELQDGIARLNAANEGDAEGGLGSGTGKAGNAKKSARSARRVIN